MNNAFFNIDPDDKVPESLKKTLVSEIDTVRNAMELITLYVGNFFSTAGVMTTPELPKSKNNQENNHTAP
jgi:hypothetical protein